MSSRGHIRKLMEFAKISSRFEKEPGFSTLLGLNCESLLNRPISFDNQAGLKVRLHANKFLPGRNSVSLATYLAMIDEATTWALVLADPQRSRPGKSIVLRAEWGPGHNSTTKTPLVAKEVDLEANVHKIGRNLGFTGAQVQDSTTGDAVCFASHVKYLPMGFLVDLALSSYGWKATNLYAEHVLSSHSLEDVLPLADAFDSLTFVSDTMATFQPLPIHASLGGPIHGGCQAILMELVATRVAQRELATELVELDTIHVEYMSPPSGKTVYLQASVLPRKDLNSPIPLCVRLLGEDGRLKSEGTLRYRKVK